eukprot:9574449-Prorocentrum_lima.AAC.1
MTSSLVGSEMCIRDREETAEPAKHVCQVHHVLLCTAGKPEETAKHVSEAVSYTHLTLPTICSV